MAQLKKSRARNHVTPQKEWKTVTVNAPLIEGVTAKYENSSLVVSGPKGEVSMRLKYPHIAVSVENNEVVIETKRFSKSLKKIMHTYRAHAKNLMVGVTEGYTYKLKVVYAKFPMTVELKGDTLNVKNFLGEKVPRTVKIPQGTTKVEVKGEDITVTGIDKEACGQIAGLIEQSTRINHLDRRVVQDGIYITNKPHKDYV